MVGARYAALGVIAEDGVDPHPVRDLRACPTAERERIGDLPRGRGLLGLVIRKRKPIRSADLNRHPERFGFPPHHPPMKSFLGVPIVLRGKVFGNLYLTEKVGAKEFDAEDEAIAVFLATKAAVAVESARLYEQSQKLVGEVQAMHRQRDLFFASMNHELRNALTGVYGWAERLVRAKGSPQALTEAANEVYEGAERTITLLNNFLDLSRLDAGKVRPVIRDVDVHAAVKRAVATVRPAADAKQQRLEEEYANGVSRVRTDPLRVEQILLNLLRNAVQHSPDAATITVRVAAERRGSPSASSIMARASRPTFKRGSSSRSSASTPSQASAQGWVFRSRADSRSCWADASPWRAVRGKARPSRSPFPLRRPKCEPFLRWRLPWVQQPSGNLLHHSPASCHESPRC